MLRGLFTTRNNKQRFLTIDEIATACCISSQKVEGWITGNLLKAGPTGENLVEAAEVVSFLVRNGMPVAQSLLPPKTRKILFITADKGAFQEKEQKIDHICQLLTTTCNILVEITCAGRQADLNILTFSPNVVVIFLKAYNKSMANTFNLLSSIPELKIILFVDDATKKAMDQGQVYLPAHLIVSDAVPVEQLTPQLNTLFEN
jgi:hypothetical protein